MGLNLKKWPFSWKPLKIKYSSLSYHIIINLMKFLIFHCELVNLANAPVFRVCGEDGPETSWNEVSGDDARSIGRRPKGGDRARASRSDPAMEARESSRCTTGNRCCHQPSRGWLKSARRSAVPYGMLIRGASRTERMRAGDERRRPHVGGVPPGLVPHTKWCEELDATRPRVRFR